MEDDYREPSVCDDCEIGDGWKIDSDCMGIGRIIK